MAGTMHRPQPRECGAPVVSMESGLDGRNNQRAMGFRIQQCCVSMESGLDGRNN